MTPRADGMAEVGPGRRPRTYWLGLDRVSVFLRCLLVGAGLAFLTGAVWGFVRGLDHLPTLGVAVIEGAVIVGVPGSIVATVVAGMISAVRRVRHYIRRPESGLGR